MGRNRSSTYAFAAAYLVLVLGLFLALGGTAYAASSAASTTSKKCDESNSASDQYCEETKVAGVKVSATAGGDTASAAATDADALPNTGLSLLGAVAVGGVLVAAGVALRRRERRKS